MTLFRHETRQRSERNRRLYAAFELAYTVVDFTAAILFLVGSVLFFYPALEHLAIWLFVLGSLCFAAKPTIRLVREVKMLRHGAIDDLASREEN
ncbi:YrhK family protein [Jannaschia sp. 2305UL9-9]|uniref:YrhK family protein n=1 Tax=Jannaschia sp. 2305UL9-9 TaxID=3121638 RepID=UPI0035270BA5